MTLWRLFLFNAFSYAFFVRRMARRLALRREPALGIRTMRACALLCLRMFPSIRHGIEQSANHLLREHMENDAARLRRLANEIVRELFEAEIAGLMLRERRFTELKALANGAGCDGEPALRAALARGGPLMLAGLHFGNLMLLITKLRLLIPDERKLMIVMHKNAPGAFFEDALRLIAEYGKDSIELVDIEQRVHLRRFLTELRRNQPVFLLFSDLHGRFGKTNACRVGNHVVRLAGGGVKLAVELGIPLVVTYATGVPFRDRCTVHFATPGEKQAPRMLAAAETVPPVLKVHQQIADCLWQALVRYPEQWHFWEHFTPYLMPAPLLDTAASGAPRESAHA
ncbi:hypothetical protein ACS0X5_09220 [Burkholderia gladioli]|uniref:hypothetical protein n=1 Tax=Burkholderia gladioli TaxID=28095 RepID=UPI00163F518B|nr:hypothetical protein [Burkholderia gladioli]